MKTYPKIESVNPLEEKKLFVTFSSGDRKIYDCTPLLQEEAFRPLDNNAFFKNVHVDKHGYGVVWNDELDLSEAELWINGIPADRDRTSPLGEALPHHRMYGSQ